MYKYYLLKHYYIIKYNNDIRKNIFLKVNLYTLIKIGSNPTIFVGKDYIIVT